MSWKAYLGPDVVKLVIATMLFGLSFAFPITGFCVEGGTVFGSPYPFYSQCNNSPSPEGVLVPGEVRFNAIALTVDVTLWYVVAATLVTLYRIWRGRRNV